MADTKRLKRESDADAESDLPGPIDDPEIGRFGERLQQVIGSESLRGFAKRASLSESVIRNYLKGATYPSLDRLVQLAFAGSVNGAWLATGRGPMRFGAHETAESVDKEFSYLPLIAAEVAAGQGREVYNEQAIAMLAFRTAWLNTELRTKAGNLVAMTVQGESMEPTFSDGDVVLVDRTATDPAREGVYVLRMDNGLLVKRLQLLPDGEVEARSDHQAYKPFTFDWPAPPHRLAIIGRVVWVGHKL